MLLKKTPSWCNILHNQEVPCTHHDLWWVYIRNMDTCVYRQLSNIQRSRAFHIFVTSQDDLK